MKVNWIACAALVLFAVSSACADDGISLVSVRDVFAVIRDGQTITLIAYALSARSTVVRDLVEAADRGAHVSVALDSRAFGSAATENRELVSVLQQHRVIVHFTSGASHIKAVVVDGAVYLSDRNWSARGSDEVVVKDSLPADRILIERAILGQPGGNDHLWTRKADALNAEMRVIDSNASRDVAVESESFGAGTVVFTALKDRAEAGDQVRLIVASSEYSSSPSEQQAVRLLRADHVDVRIGHANEKMALVGDNVFIGSANATRGLPDQIDFGIATRDERLADVLRLQFLREWNQASILDGV